MDNKTSYSFNNADFSGLKIMLASPDVMTSWSEGEVLKPETINYRTFKPEKDGLFDERIFGPTKDYECYCGKYKRIRYKGIVCDRCGVEITTSAVRRERMGHIKLASPVAHIWYFKGVSSPLSVLMSISSNNLERIIYYALYIVKSVDVEKRDAAEVIVKLERKKEIDIIQVQKDEEQKKIEEEEAKARLDVEKKMKNKEQQELTIREIEFRFRERYTSLAQKYSERIAEQEQFFDRMEKLVRTVEPMMTVEEEDYLYLMEKQANEFLSVGMGSEVLLEILSTLDLKKMYADLRKNLGKLKGDKRLKTLKKVRLVEAFLKAKISPNWMVLVVLPVIPPDLRPVVQLSGGKFATSDLNDFYRRVINRNNRLKHLIELGAPEIILRNEKRMLQEAVDSLIDLSKSRGAARRNVRTKALKSLSEVLKGKQGRFRQNLLGKRVDYSGRSVIIGGPDLKLNQCGLPKEMALELFKPFLLREVIIRGYAQNIKSAKNFLDTKDPVIYDILEEITKDHPVMLNRAPTLHKLSILAFYPVLTDDHAIKLHPTVCAGFNADFDGDQMGVYVPLSAASIEEVKTRMLPEKNLLKPSDGSPIVVPNKDMALGTYYLTTLDKNFEGRKEEDMRAFSSPNEALAAYDQELVATREPIKVKMDDDLIITSVGRILFNQQLPKEMQYINDGVKASGLKRLVTDAIKISDGDTSKLAELIDNLKEFGFKGATISGGLSWSVMDCFIIDDKARLIAEAEKKVTQIVENYNKGLITDDERRRMVTNIWIDITEDMATKTWDLLADENPVKLAIMSEGPRASREQLKQLSSMKGLVIDPLGKIIEVPTKSNYREGLNIFEYVISARGARKGLIDSALKTADAGYLTRRLVDVTHDMIVREEDCGLTTGVVISNTGERGDKFLSRLAGRVLAQSIKEGNKIIIEAGTLIGEAEINLLSKKIPDSAVVRSPLYCKTEHGCCQLCYGLEMSSGKMVTVGTPIGVVAAQSIGEPGTQLTMRVRHFGGIVIADVTQGLPRVEELFEVRTPKVLSPISDISGKVSIIEDTQKDIYMIKIVSVDKDGSEREYQISTGRRLKVEDGELIAAGQELCEGYLDVKEILSIKGLSEAQIYLLSEIQKVYESQGIAIHDKHFETIIRKMSDKVIVDVEGDTKFIMGEVISKYKFETENKKVVAQGGTPAVGRISILGITRAAMYSDSWLSAASFQGTTNVLTQASIHGQVDHLLGLKENVIIGRLIPVTAALLNKYYGEEEATPVEPAESQTADEPVVEETATEETAVEETAVEEAQAPEAEVTEVQEPVEAVAEEPVEEPVVN